MDRVSSSFLRSSILTTLFVAVVSITAEERVEARLGGAESTRV